MNTDLNKIKSVLTAQLQRNNVVANNLANANTIGFKRETIFMEVMRGQQNDRVHAVTATDFAQGTLKATNNPLDVALSGKGLFTIDHGSEESYTRDGHFNIDEFGVLRTTGGAAVLGLSGIINVAVNGLKSPELSINSHGDIYANNQFIDRLKITSVESVSDLVKIGANQFKVKDGSIVQEVLEPQVRQGFLEESNVNPVTEMVELMELQRQFESSQRVVRTIDQALNTTVNKISDYR